MLSYFVNEIFENLVHYNSTLKHIEQNGLKIVPRDCFRKICYLKKIKISVQRPLNLIIQASDQIRHFILATRVNSIGSLQKEYKMKALCPGYTKVHSDFFLTLPEKSYG